jgi:predicted dehydrogenase
MESSSDRITVMSSETISRSRPVRIGVVGAGLIAQVAHLPLLRGREAEFSLAGLAEPDAATRRRVAARFGIATATPTQGELLAATDLDAVLIASPNGAHAGQVLEALEAGLHVLVEKPLCLSAEDAERIVAARDRAGRVVQVGYMKRYDPAVEALLDELGDAELLHVDTVTHDPGLRRFFAPGADDPRATAPGDRRARWWSEVFLGALVHDVNLVHAVLERAGAGAGAERVADAFAGDDRAGGTIVLAGGARWSAAWLALPAVDDFRERIDLYCADGIRRLEFPAPYLLKAPTLYTREEGDRRRVRRAFEEAYDRALAHFRACLAGETACRTPPEQAARDMALLGELFSAATPAEALA